MSALGAGGTLGTAAAFLDGDVHGGTVAVVVVAAAGIITADRRFGGGRHVVGADIAICLIVAVTVAYGISRSGMMDAHAVQTAPAAFVMTAIGLRTVKITHTEIHLRIQHARTLPKHAGICRKCDTKSSQGYQISNTFGNYADK